MAFALLTLIYSLAVPGTDQAPIPIPRFAQVDAGLYRGARPRQAGVQYLAQLGVKTILNLERELFEDEPGEVRKERAWAAAYNLRFVHIPLHP